MRIGVFVLSENATGGVHQYTHQIIRSLHDFDHGHQVVAFSTARNPDLEKLARPGWKVRLLRTYAALWKVRSLFPRSSRAAGGTSTGLALRRWLGRHVVGRAARRESIDLMIFPSPCAEAAACGIPFTMTIHDIQHRIHPEFPEVSEAGEFERREEIYATASKAAAVTVDSMASREDVARLYGAAPDRIHPLPSVSPPYLQSRIHDEQKARVKRKYGLPDEYLFYPAQFWPHKNHLRLVEAASRVQGMSVVFGGSENVPFSTAEIVREKMRELLPGRAWMLGYVPSEDMAPLYAASSMLVMPTFFGPTNIPIVEAFALGVPVITSDLRGVREQTGDAALLVDPTNIEAMADAIRRLRSDPDLRREFVRRGSLRANAWTEADFARSLLGIINACSAELGRR